MEDLYIVLAKAFFFLSSRDACILLVFDASAQQRKSCAMFLCDFHWLSLYLSHLKLEKEHFPGVLIIIVLVWGAPYLIGFLLSRNDTL